MNADAANANAQISDFDFDKIFDGASWFHTTGITPALSDKATALSCIIAKAKGVTTSIDLNYRKKLWSRKGERSMTNLCQYVDVCIGNKEDAETTFGFKSKGTDVSFVDRVGIFIQMSSGISSISP